MNIMTIDSLYNKMDKSNYFMGRVSQVYRDNSVVQVENLSVLSHRKLLDESLIPNTINYLVVIDSVRGVFLGEVFQNKVGSSDKIHDSINFGNTESVYPELNIDIIGIMADDDRKFRLPEFTTVGVAEKVYFANEKVIQIYLQSVETTKTSEVQLKSFATYLNMNDVEVSFKPSTLFDHHLFAVGTTNSGKSTSALSILDKLIEENKKILIIDPTGEYRDSFSEQEVKKLNLGVDTIISPSKLSMQQWSVLFEMNSNTQGAVLAEAIKSLRYQHKKGENCCLEKVGKNIAELQKELASIHNDDNDFDISLLPEQIAAESVEEARRGDVYDYSIFRANSNSYLVQKVSYQLSNTNFLDFFKYDPQKKNLLDEVEAFIHTPNTSLYINSSELGASEGIGGMIIDLICNCLISQDKIIPFVFFIDEVHRYTKSPYSEEEFHDGLVLLAREGRKKGIFLFLTSQNPQDVSPILLGQMGTLLIHRLTHDDEIRTVKNHLDEYSVKQVKKLNRGEAILTSVNLIKNIYLNIKKCERKQYNDTPFL